MIVTVRVVIEKTSVYFKRNVFPRRFFLRAVTGTCAGGTQVLQDTLGVPRHNAKVIKKVQKTHELGQREQTVSYATYDLSSSVRVGEL